jgi:hypothetical protein
MHRYGALTSAGVTRFIRVPLTSKKLFEITSCEMANFSPIQQNRNAGAVSSRLSKDCPQSYPQIL